MELDTGKWSGEGEFTQALIEHLRQVPAVAFIRVEDAPASRSEADYNFISNEIFVGFATRTVHERARKWGVVPVTKTIETKVMTLGELETVFTATSDVGAPDYSDGDMLQYLRAQRIIPPYQTRGYKLVELVRLYEVGREPVRS